MSKNSIFRKLHNCKFDIFELKSNYLFLQKCSTEEIQVLKVIPNTGCKQVKKPVCTDPVCPLIVENEVCSDIEKTVRKVTKRKVA